MKKLPPGWTETIVTEMDFNREISTAKYHQRVLAQDIYKMMFAARGVRMTNKFSLEIDPPFEIEHDQRANEVIVRQGPAPVTT